MSEAVASQVKVGQPVPDVSAQVLASDGSFQNVKISDFKGKWVVLFFYPLDFTFVCPTEIQGFDAKYEEFQKLGAEVLTASTDSVFSHKAWQEQGLGKLKYSMVGDTNHEWSKTFGVLVEDKGIALRGTFVIDPDGILRSAVVNDLPVGRNVDETLRTVQAFQTGELVQCGWQPGENTLGKA